MPSTTDVKQLQKIARSRLYRCPEPVLVILGGDPANLWTMRAFVFQRTSKSRVELVYLPNSITRITSAFNAPATFGSQYADALKLSSST